MKKATPYYISLLAVLVSAGSAVAQLKLPEIERVSSSTEITSTLSLQPLEQDSTASLLLQLPSLMPTAYFCKLEHHADHGVKWKRRFRLGSVDYVDRLEGKY